MGPMLLFPTRARCRALTAFWATVLVSSLVSSPATAAGREPVSRVAITPQKGDGAAAMRAARAAVGAGSLDRAKEHLERALASKASRVEAALLLAEVAKRQGAKDPMARAARLWLEANVDAQGRLATRPPKGVFVLPDSDLDAAKVLLPAAVARARAVQSLVDFAKKRESQGARSAEQLLTAAWARRVGLDLAQSMPGLVDSVTPNLRPAVSVPKGAHSSVLKAVERVGTKALSAGRPGLAIRAGRILHGLGVQADFKDLKGPRPSGMAKWRAKGAKMMAAGRDRLETSHERPWTVEELEWLATEEGEAFTRERSDFAAPGVAISPDGLYRIESDCGHETLLAAARTIEFHHRRLVDEFGSDPFSSGGKVRQGLVRIVPDPSGLEAEGAPFFWAGGFQSGDTTVVRQTSGTVEGLGRLLTHELTHRFDGALHPGIPSWLAEGRAVWTGAAYGAIEDEAFKRDYGSWGTMQTVANYGYAGRRQLELLVSGTPSDYRQNYSAGNALYVFLRTWFPGKSESFDGGEPVFAERLVAFEDSGKHASSPKGRLADFTAAFCDGEDGRPDTFEGFAKLFREFVYGFDAFKPAPAAKRYGGVGGGGSTWIYDEPTWTWDWVRAEPRFGQTQARRAGELLAEHGRAGDAIRAFVWARAVDGYDARTAWGLSALLEEGSGKVAAEEALFAVTSELHGEPFGALGGDYLGASGPSFATAIPAAKGLLSAELEVARDLAAAGASQAAARAVREARRFSRFVGLPEPELPEGLEVLPPDLEAPALAFDELGGWLDESLTRVDERRPKELFYVAGDGGLHLGRRKPRAGSGRIDRSGGGKSFVRGERWMLPGQYRLKTQIRFTTGFNTALAVIGWQTRDRNVRLQIRAGSYLYSIGKEEEEPKFEKVSWRFDGMRTRDGGLPGSARGGSIKLPAPSTAVTLELVVDGARVSAWIAGQYAGSYHVVDGSPIEGYVGFGTLRGAVRVAPPIVRREDGDRAGVLDLSLGAGPSFEQLQNVTIRLPDGATPPSNGMLMLWVPAYAKADPEKGKKATIEAAVGRTRRAARQLLQRMSRNDVVQSLVIALPERFGEELDAQTLLAELENVRLDGQPAPRVVLHAVDAGEISAIDDGRRWLMFVDGFGIARATRPWSGPTAIDDGPLEHWLTVFRDHGRPADRVLPKVTREADTDEGEDDEDDD